MTQTISNPTIRFTGDIASGDIEFTYGTGEIKVRYIMTGVDSENRLSVEWPKSHVDLERKRLVTDQIKDRVIAAYRRRKKK